MSRRDQNLISGFVRGSGGDSRLILTTDNTKANIDISSIIALATALGALKVSEFGDPTPKVLGTSDPSAATNTALYNVATAKIGKVTILNACNRSNATVQIRVGIDVGGNGTNTPTDAEWIYYDLDVLPNKSVTLDVAQGLWLAALDDLVVYASASDMSFIASGIEYA